ncbi:NAD(+) kinase [Coccidioides posadasii str. Silveira]|uniref:NAD+ kinase n=2 Tax=Coccidioides posadasii TaxID=199306 RepID=E9D5L5_COCPS|nr:NAD+ kinase [Coccidioides posadasii str. Silveira]QVM10385.1 NAD(+) kinase [Coccidioides posadasii str. Silveira]
MSPFVPPSPLSISHTPSHPDPHPQRRQLPSSSAAQEHGDAASCGEASAVSRQSPEAGSRAIHRGSALNLTPIIPTDPQMTDHGRSSTDEAPADLLPSLEPSVSRESRTIASLPASPFQHIPHRPAPISSRNHHHHQSAKSIDGIPRQTLMKALASQASSSAESPSLSIATSLAEMLSPTSNAGSDQQTGDTRLHRQLSAALSAKPLTFSDGDTPSTARFPLKSPCYYHQRFDGAVNIQRVLEEIAADEWMSHSRLMQTATGVREVSKQLQRRPIKVAVKNVMIVTKARDNGLVYLTRELAEWLLSTPRYGSDLGVNVYVDSKLRRSARFDAPGLLRKEPRFESMLKYWTPDLCWTSPETFDLVITLGGDGTVLFTSWLFQRIVPPILAFSLGSLGFLTNFEFSKYKEHLNHIMGDVGMRVNLRMRFTCTVYRADHSNKHRPGAVEEGEQFEVVNELVIDRGPSPYVSNLEVYGDDELLTIVQADGCILSTPTGSTAYSLSAGGSLIHPSIPAILLTPICPHTLSFRPMVLSDTLLLRIAIPPGSRSTAYCSFDGKGRIELCPGDYVTLEASQYPFPTVVSGGGEWFESVRRTLCWNVRGAVQKGWSSKSHRPEGEQMGLDPMGTPRGQAPEAVADEQDDEEEKWDIDTDSYTDFGQGTDSGLGPSECGDSPGTTSPLKRVMSLLNM